MDNLPGKPRRPTGQAAAFRKLEPEKRASIEAAIAASYRAGGKSLIDVATEFETTAGTVRAVLERAGVAVRRRGVHKRAELDR